MKRTIKWEIVNLLAKKALKRWPYLPAIVGLCLGIGVSIAAYKITNKLEQARVNAVFERRSAELVGRLQANLQEYSQITRLIGLTYEFDREVSRAKFELLSKKILPYNRGILAIGELKIEGDRNIVEKIELNYGRKVPLELNENLALKIRHKNTIARVIKTKVIAQTRLEENSNKFIIYRAIENENNSKFDRVIFAIYDLQETVETSIKANRSNLLDFQLYLASIDRLQSSLMKPQLQDIIQPILNYDRQTNLLGDRSTVQLQRNCSLDREWFKCLRALDIAGEEMSLLILPDNEIKGNDALLSLAIAITATIALVIYLLMSVELQKSYAALEKANLELEDRVKKRTAQLQQAKEVAEAAVLTKDRFLVNISHELRSPLNAILGYANSLLNSRNLKPGQLLSLRIIKQSGTHLLSLINDILDFSKTQAAKIEITPKDIHLSSFLEEIEGMVIIRAKEKNIYFKSQAIGELPLGIKADEKRLRQILLNLLSNAIKFTDSGGVTFKAIGIAQNTIRFEIIDTGIGIATERLETIFKPFEQAGDDRNRIKGTGLGLSISKQLVELMDSKIEVKSKLGVGSVFWFDLVVDIIDVKKAPSRDLTKLEIVGYKGSKRKILVVDDLEANRLLLRNILQPLGFEIVEAANGVEGLDLACDRNFDLILTDLLMPCKSGLMMTIEIRKIADYKNTPIIALSASSPEIMAKQSKNVGCNDFISKPIDEKQLLKCLEHHLNLEWIYAYFASVSSN